LSYDFIDEARGDDSVECVRPSSEGVPSSHVEEPVLNGKPQTVTMSSNIMGFILSFYFFQGGLKTKQEHRRHIVFATLRSIVA